MVPWDSFFSSSLRAADDLGKAVGRQRPARSAVPDM